MKDKGAVYMSQNAPKFMGSAPRKKVCDVLKLSLDDILETPEIISTGEPTLVVSVASRAALAGISPDFESIKQLEQSFFNCLLYVFTNDTVSPESQAHGRMFAPLYGIGEEAATGIASGAAACYLFKHGASLKTPTRIVFEQGYSLGRPSEIIARLKVRQYEIKEVAVGGIALTQKAMEISV